MMKVNRILRFRNLFLLPLCLAVSVPIVSASESPQGPVSYTSANQLSQLFSQLEQAAQTAQVDLAKLRIEKWKADSGSKRQAQGNVESIQRNLQSALPEIISELRTSPENLTSTFKLYRNLDALYDVFESVAESAGAFGSKDDFQSLQNDVTSFEKARRSVADRMEGLAGAKETEITHLRSALQTAQANAPSQPPKKVVVDDVTPVKKPVKKKAAPKGNPATNPAPGNPPPTATPPQ
jgi:multidrug efflux pump subunit AcrA (membrane-fusion protein)